MDIPSTGAIFTLGKSYLAENTQSYFYIKNDPVKRLVAGSQQSAVICESGRLFVWGENHYGQLGIGGHGSHSHNHNHNHSQNHNQHNHSENNRNSNAHDIITKPTCVKSLKTLGAKICDAAFGQDWTVILTLSNEIFYTGRNIFPNETHVALNFITILENNEELSIIRKPFRLEEFDDYLSKNEQPVHFVSILAGNEHFAVLTSDGRLIGCGSNAQQQLGGELEADYDGHPIEIVLDAPVKQFVCGPESTLILTKSGNLFLTGRLNEFVFPKFTLLQNNLSASEQIIFMHISKTNEIYILTNVGNIYRSYESMRNRSLVFQRFYDYDSEENGPIWKLLKGSNFYAVLSKAHKFFTTFSESGLHLKTFREISKFKNLRLLDIEVGDNHILVHGIPRSSTSLSTTVGPNGEHHYMSRSYILSPTEMNGNDMPSGSAHCHSGDIKNVARQKARDKENNNGEPSIEKPIIKERIEDRTPKGSAITNEFEDMENVISTNGETAKDARELSKEEDRLETIENLIVKGTKDSLDNVTYKGKQGIDVMGNTISKTNDAVTDAMENVISNGKKETKELLEHVDAKEKEGVQTIDNIISKGKQNTKDSLDYATDIGKEGIDAVGNVFSKTNNKITNAVGNVISKGKQDAKDILENIHSKGKEGKESIENLISKGKEEVSESIDNITSKGKNVIDTLGSVNFKDKKDASEVLKNGHSVEKVTQETIDNFLSEEKDEAAATTDNVMSKGINETNENVENFISKEKRNLESIDDVISTERNEAHELMETIKEGKGSMEKFIAIGKETEGTMNKLFNNQKDGVEAIDNVNSKGKREAKDLKKNIFTEEEETMKNVLSKGMKNAHELMNTIQEDKEHLKKVISNEKEDCIETMENLFTKAETDSKELRKNIEDKFEQDTTNKMVTVRETVREMKVQEIITEVAKENELPNVETSRNKSSRTQILVETPTSYSNNQPKSPTDSIRSYKSGRSIKFDASAQQKGKTGEKQLRPRTPYPTSSNDSTPQTIKKTPLRNFSYEAAMDHDHLDRISPELLDSLETVKENVIGELSHDHISTLISTPTPPTEEDEQLAVEITTTKDELNCNKEINEIRFINNGVDVTANVNENMPNTPWEQSFDELESDLKNAIHKTDEHVDKLVVATEEKQDQVEEALDNIGNKIEAKMLVARDSMQNVMRRAATGARGAVGTVGDGAKRLATDALGNIEEAASSAAKAADDTKTAMKNAIGSVGTTISKGMDEAKENLSTLFHVKTGKETHSAREDDNSLKAGNLKTHTTNGSGEEDERTTASVNSNQTSAGNLFESGNTNPFEQGSPYVDDLDAVVERGKKAMQEDLRAMAKKSQSQIKEVAAEEIETSKGRVRQFFDDVRAKGKGISCRSDKSIQIDDESTPPPLYAKNKVNSEISLHNGRHGDQHSSKVCTIL